MHCCTAPDRQELNPTDILLLGLHRALRAQGQPGFNQQMHVWLDGRVDTAALSAGVARLAQQHPTATARLSGGRRDRAHWKYRAGAECRLAEMDLPANDDRTFLAVAAELLARPAELDRDDPIRFHLLHFPDGRDVFLVQYDHVLTDPNAMVPLLKEIEHVTASKGLGAAPVAEPSDLVCDYLAAVPRRERRAIAQKAARFRRVLLNSPIASLGTTPQHGSPVLPNRLALRELDEAATRRFLACARKCGGFPSASMALLASSFRSIARLAVESPSPESLFLANIGINLRPRDGGGRIFANQCSLIPLAVRPADLSDRSRLVQLLNARMREQVEGRHDLGVVETATWGDAGWERILNGLMPRVRHPLYGVPQNKFHAKFNHRLAGHLHSLSYGYFGSLVRQNETFCGVPIRRLYHTVHCWPPAGLSLLANQCGGRLLISASWSPDTVSDSLADQFLDAVIDDLSVE